MKLETGSKILLGLSKAKSKMRELKVEANLHPELADNPIKLLILTIGILGELSALVAKGEGADRIFELKGQLVDVAQYFDSLNQSGLLGSERNYLRLVGAAAYYLADMPGSASVLARDLQYNFERLTPSFIEGILVWILKSDFSRDWYLLNYSYCAEASRQLASVIIDFYKGVGDEGEVWQSLAHLREIVYEFGDDRELLFVDVIGAVVKVKLGSSARACLPLFSNLDVALWEPVLSKAGFMQEFWPAQKLMGQIGILRGESAVVQMPTSAGKSRAMELVIRSSFLSRRARVVVVVAPFRALCSEISETLRVAFLAEAVSINELPDVNQVSDDERAFLSFLLGDGYRDSSQGAIIVATPEKLAYILRHEEMLAKSIDLLLFDEGHQFDTGRRGVTYELLISYLRASVKLEAQKVMISAVMANAKSIGDWLNFERGVEIQASERLPTVRAIGFSSWKDNSGGLQFFDQRMSKEGQYFVPQVWRANVLPRRKGERVEKYFPEKGDNISIATFLAVKLCGLGGTAVFCGDKRTVKSICKNVVDYFDRGINIHPPLSYGDSDEIAKLAYLAALHLGDSEYAQAISIGVMPHSASIPMGIRASVEWAISNGKASLVVCTSTLAQGVNLPIKYLLITSIFQAGSEITARDFQNLIGRAGRSGYYTEGNIIFTDPELYDGRWGGKQGRWRWGRVVQLLDFGSAEACLSSLKGLVDKLPFPGEDIEPIDFVKRPGYWVQIASSLGNGLPNGRLVEEMLSRLDRIRAVESYVITFLGDNPGVLPANSIEALALETLAYSLSDEFERERLLEVFNIIAERVEPLERVMLKGYGRSLLGVDQIGLVEQWTRDNEFELGNVDSSDDVLTAVWPLICDVGGKAILKKIKPERELLDLARMWIAGKSYSEMWAHLVLQNGFYQAGRQRRQLTVDHVVDFADGALGYDAMLIVGGLSDILEARGILEESVVHLRTLQSRLKYGLASDFEIGMCVGRYPDREVCKAIMQALAQAGVASAIYRPEMVDDNKPIVDAVLARFPSFFSRRD